MRQYFSDHLKSRIIAAFVILIFIAALVITVRAGADLDYAEGAYEVSGLDLRIAVSRDHTYEIEEFISVDIPETIPSMAFAIPGDTFRMEELTVEGETAKAVRRDSEKYAVIKDPKLLTAGHHIYMIRYKLTEGADRNSGRDVFNFDILPAGWKQPVYKLHALMWFPYGFPLEDIRPYVDESRVSRLTIKKEPQSRSYTLEIRGIPEDYSVRVEADLQDGYWD